MRSERRRPGSTPEQKVVFVPFPTGVMSNLNTGSLPRPASSFSLRWREALACVPQVEGLANDEGGGGGTLFSRWS